MRVTILLVSIVALAFALAVFVAGPGTRLGIWKYTTGLGLIFIPAKPLVPSIALSGPIYIAAIASALASIAALLAARGMVPLSFIATASVVIAAMVPFKMNEAIKANPFIHDITTDFARPPQILAAAGLPRSNPASYDGGEFVERTNDKVTVAEAQQVAFPDIGPLYLTMEIDDAVAVARAAIIDMKMEILAEEPVGEDSGGDRRIEAVYTSRGFGFKDDFIVRLSSSEDEGVRVDLRSKSRVGKSDLGDNAARAREFLGRMKP
jgi:uncharacterized protein (DUF1499 family)